MSKLSVTSRDILDLMKGCEVQSLNYEGCVSINGAGKVYMDGEVIDILDSTRKVNKIWKEYLESDGIY